MILFRSKDDEVELPNPTLGESTSVLRDITVHVSRGGRLTSVLGPEIAPSDVQTLITDFQFSLVRRDLFFLFKDFLEETSGDKITYVDRFGIEWNCVILGETFSYQENPLSFKCGLGAYDFDIVVRRWK